MARSASCHYIKGGFTIKIKWYGTASLMLESRGTKILFDPFLKRTGYTSLSRQNPALSGFLKEECEAVSAIFITHPHLDHFADINMIREYCSAPVYVAGRGVKSAKQAGYGMGSMHPLHPGEKYYFGDLSIEIFQSRHCVFDAGIVLHTLGHIKNRDLFAQGLEIQHLNRQFPIGKEDIFAFDIKAEKKEIFLLGSANTAKGTLYPTGMDLLVFPYQGRYHMADYSLPFLEKFRPARVMLDHFDDAFPPISSRADCAEFIRMAEEKYPHIEIFEPLENQWYEV